MIMKSKCILLIILVISILIGISLLDKVLVVQLVVQLVIPKELLPYYEWLISFPGIKPLPEPPSQEILPSYITYLLQSFNKRFGNNIS